MRESSYIRFQQTGPADGTFFDTRNVIAEIKDLRLSNARMVPGGPVVIGSRVPMPLYWWQYANHQDPDRRADSNGNIRVRQATGEFVRVLCAGTNASRSILSSYALQLAFSQEKGSYVYHIAAKLKVADQKTWLVTPNPVQGEIEFCNFWPERTFLPRRGRKLYQACYAQRAGKSVRIPHHHIETADKHNILLNQGDRFLWGIENTNPVIHLLSSTPTWAALCAYMWDAHFAYRICRDSESVVLTAGTQFSAEFELYALRRKQVKAALEHAREARFAHPVPIFVDGLNTFDLTISGVPNDKLPEVWPWTFETDQGGSTNVHGHLDAGVGYRNPGSLCTRHATPARSMWTSTALGPAFGKPPFRDNVRHRLSAFVKTRNLTGEACVALRWHRFEQGSVFDIEDYETIDSEKGITGTTEWTNVHVVTPRISPAPDRMHILLQVQGTGTAWFDHVLFEPNLD